MDLRRCANRRARRNTLASRPRREVLLGGSSSSTGTAYTLKCDALPCTAVMSAPNVAPGKPIVATLRCSGSDRAIVMEMVGERRRELSDTRGFRRPADPHRNRACHVHIPRHRDGTDGDKASGVFPLAWK